MGQIMWTRKLLQVKSCGDGSRWGSAGIKACGHGSRWRSNHGQSMWTGESLGVSGRQSMWWLGSKHVDTGVAGGQIMVKHVERESLRVSGGQIM